MAISDETNLEAAAVFDIDDWMSRSGISSFTGNNKAEEAHPTLKKGKLKKNFSVPSVSDFASNGDFSVQFSGPIDVYDPL